MSDERLRDARVVTPDEPGELVVGLLFALTPAEHATLGHTRGWCHNSALCRLCAAENRAYRAETDVRETANLNRGLRHSLDGLIDQVERLRGQLEQVRDTNRARLQRTQRHEQARQTLRGIPPRV